MTRLWNAQLKSASDKIQRLELESDGKPTIELYKAKLEYANSIIMYGHIMAGLAKYEPTKESMAECVLALSQFLWNAVVMAEVPSHESSEDNRKEILESLDTILKFKTPE